MVKKYTNYFKHILIHLVSFLLNYFIFILLMYIINSNGVYGIQIVNLFSWCVSMLFIYYVDKYFVPDLVNENNSKELFQFILIRILGLIIEAIILFMFVSILQNNYYLVKIISLIFLFILNHFYVSRVKFK